MAFLRYDKNEHGVKIGVFKCDTCGDEFTVVPAPTKDRIDAGAWNGCLAPDCASYVPKRDFEKTGGDKKPGVTWDVDGNEVSITRERGWEKEEPYLIVCLSRSRYDRTVHWWRPEKAGYSIFLNDAGRYTKEEAEKIVKAALGDEIAVPLSFAERLWIQSVRMDSLEWSMANCEDAESVLHFNKKKEPDDA